MKRYIGLFKEAFAEFGDDKAQRLAAALAYYTIFSIAPLLLIAIAIAGLVFGREAAQHQIVGELRGLFGSAGATAVEDMLKSAAKPKSSTFAIVAGAVTLLFGAAGVFGQLKSAMNTIWDVEEKKGGGIGRLIKDRFLSFAMVMGVGFLLLVTLVVDAGLNAMGAYAEQHLPGGEAPWHLIQFFVSFGVITVLFTMIFRFLPDARPEFRDVWLGATFTAFLFTVGKVGLGLYLGRESVGSAYGAAGSLVVLLLWIYWSTNILFFGAEFTQVYARTHGSMRGSGAPRLSATAAAPRDSAPPKGGLDRTVGIVAGVIISVITATSIFVKSVKRLFT